MGVLLDGLQLYSLMGSLMGGWKGLGRNIMWTNEWCNCFIKTINSLICLVQKIYCIVNSCTINADLF